MITITYYDVSNIDYASFFLKGFMELADSFPFRFEVKKQIPTSFSKTELATAEIGLSKTLLFSIEDQDRLRYFCIDTYDASGTDPEDPGYDTIKLQQCDYYFKVNYRKDVLARDPELRVFADKIVPVCNVFPVKMPSTTAFMPKLLPIGGRRWTREESRRRLRKLSHLPELDTFRELRQKERDLDVFFLVAYYKAERHQETNEWRLTVMEELAKHKHIRTFVGFAGDKSAMPPHYARFHQERMSFESYLDNLARSRIGIYVRGTSDCLSYKFGQLFALGKPIVGESIFNNREILYQYDSFGEQFCYDTPHAIVDRVLDLIDQPHKIEALREANERTFEDKLAPRPIVRHILQTLGLAEPVYSA